MNFRKALARSTGDYVFLCDQDDIWMPDKIESMTRVMDSHPEIRLLASNYIPIRDGVRFKVSVKDLERNDGSLTHIRLSDSWLNTMRPGCTFCARHGLIEGYKVLDIEGTLHDSMLWRYAIASDSLFRLNSQLVYFRRHQGNTSNQFSRTTPTITQRINNTEWTMSIYKSFIGHAKELRVTSKNISLMNKRLAFLARRKKILARRSVMLTSLFVILNLKYYPTFRNALSDIYAVMFLK